MQHFNRLHIYQYYTYKCNKVYLQFEHFSSDLTVMLSVSTNDCDTENYQSEWCRTHDATDKNNNIGFEFEGLNIQNH